MFKNFVQRGMKADFSFTLEIRYNCARLGQEVADIDGMPLLHQTLYGALAERQPRHTVNGIHGRANHGLEFECGESAAELTALAQTYCLRQYQRQTAQADDDDQIDWCKHPIDEEDAAAVFYKVRRFLQVRVTVWYASAEHVSVQKTFDMELDEDEATTFAGTDDNDWITIPLSFNGQARRGVSMPLTMRVVPERTETGAEWKVVFDRFFVREAESGRGREGKQGHNEDVSGKFEESEIDSMREQKLRELEEYRRQVQLEQHQTKRRASSLTTRKQSVSAGTAKRGSAVRRSSVF